MKTINLYFDFEFTSLSPDAQPISLGIVSDNFPWMNKLDTHKSDFGNLDIYEAGTFQVKSKSFYAEFSDFDINRCDDWVKENVVSKLRFQSYHGCYGNIEGDNKEIKGKLDHIQNELSTWLSQFSDYQIQFVCDKNNYQWEAFKRLIRINDSVNQCKEIILTKGKTALVDLEDFDKISSFKWHTRIVGNNRAVAVRRRLKSEGYDNINEKSFMHRQIMGLGNESEDMIYVDHINGDSLDNRKCNLRLVTKAENNYNRKSAIGSKSNYVGVTFHEPSGKYRAFIGKGRKYKHLLSSDDEIKCAKAYDHAAKKLYGEYAKLNFPDIDLNIYYKRSDLLPDNISPVPFDLNDLIAIKKGITPKEAFDLNREELAFGGLFIVPDNILPPDISKEELLKLLKENYGGIIMLPKDSEAPKIEKIVPGENNKHNALWDAKVIKEIYQKLK